jgi:DNA-nicking Smr family endonuclease
MKTPKSTGVFRPFENLKALLENQSMALERDLYVRPQIPVESGECPETDIDIFERAMADVKKISRKNCVDKNGMPQTSGRSQTQTDGESETLLQLENLVKHGTGFVVANTPEYIEGREWDVHPEITRRLHRGDFSIQGYIDLHGLNLDDAHLAFEKFLKQSISSGKRVVMIIHGRGLSSPAEPILKTNIYRWLCSGFWRKWVGAFCSARWCDGGAGATYVLLRQRPITKRFRKNGSPKSVCSDETKNSNS